MPTSDTRQDPQDLQDCYDEMRGGGLHHESYLKGDAAYTWLHRFGVDVERVTQAASVGSLAVNIAPTNGIEGCLSLLKSGPNRGRYLVSGLPWAEGEYLATLPPAASEVLALMTGGRILRRTDYIGAGESAEAPARASLLRACGLTVMSWSVPSKGLVRQVEHYTCISSVRAAPPDTDAPSLASVLAPHIPRLLEVQEVEFTRKYELTMRRLRANAQECVERAAGTWRKHRGEEQA